MATTVINNVELNANAFAVWEVIKKFQGKKGFCWATNETLAQKAKVSKSYISHQITRLVRAGLIHRHIEYDKSRQILYRQLVAFNEAKETAVAEAEVQKLMEDKTESGPRNRLIENGKNVGIAPTLTMNAILTFGAKRVEEALAILKASNSAKNPIKYFYAALRKGFKPGKKASKQMGIVYTDARREIVPLPSVNFTEIQEEKEVAAFALDPSLTLKEKFAILRGRIKSKA